MSANGRRRGENEEIPVERERETVIGQSMAEQRRAEQKESVFYQGLL